MGATLRERIEIARRHARLDPVVVRRWTRRHFHLGESWDVSRAMLPRTSHPHFGEWASPALTVAERHDSQLDGATKLLLRTTDGLLIETVVLRIATGRTTLCLSSQVGCAANCGFCATGQMGLRRNLTDAEIVEQVRVGVGLARAEGRDVRNLVLMGMGEPLHNEAAVYAALAFLTSPRGPFGPERVIVSTVGVPAAVARLSERFPRIGVALSLHSADPDVRLKLIPSARHASLPDLAAALQRLPRSPMLEYLMLDGLTDRPADEALLIDFARRVNGHVNLIPFNHVDGSPYRPTPPERVAAFAATLKAAGLQATTRRSLGRDIAAACGQLVREQPPRGVTLPLA